MISFIIGIFCVPAFIFGLEYFEKIKIYYVNKPKILKNIKNEPLQLDDKLNQFSDWDNRFEEQNGKLQKNK